jgi:exodeoxyribonuclease-3
VLRIATWNVNGLRARLDLILLWLRERQPDIAGFQELKLPSEQFPHDVFLKEGYRAVVHGQKSWNGVAVLSRGEPVVARQGLPGHEDAGARLLTARVGDLSFTSIYVPNGKSVGHEDFPRKLAWLDGLVACAQEGTAGSGPAILAGDFNLCPAGLDSYDEEGLRGSIFHTGEERERFSKLLASGYRDLYREAHPGGREFSWWDYRAGAFHRGMGLRIDLLLGTPDVAARLRSVAIDRDYRKKRDGLTPSDHAPVIAEID